MVVAVTIVAGDYQGRIQDFKLGVAQMNGEIWKGGGGVFFILFLLNVFILYRVNH